MCRSDRIGQAVARRAGEDQINARLKISTMTDRDKHRFYVVPRSQHDPKLLTIMREWAARTSFASGFLIGADQPRFPTANRRAIQPQPHMRGNPQTAWVHDAHAIEDENIRFLLKLKKGFFQHWPFAETEQAGNIRK